MIASLSTQSEFRTGERGERKHGRRQKERRRERRGREDNGTDEERTREKRWTRDAMKGENNSEFVDTEHVKVTHEQEGSCGGRRV
jgi:hypothetical protein